LTGLTGYSGLKHQNLSCKSSSKSLRNEDEITFPGMHHSFPSDEF
jgi:hypothetical protein